MVNFVSSPKNITIIVILAIFLLSLITGCWHNLNTKFNSTGPLGGSVGMSSPSQCAGILESNVINDSSIRITRTCILLSLILMSVGLYFILSNSEYNKFTYILFITAGVLSLIGNILYKSYLKNYDNTVKISSSLPGMGGSINAESSLGYSWYLNTICGIAGITAGVLIHQNILL